MKMDDLGGKPTIFGNTHIQSLKRTVSHPENMVSQKGNFQTSNHPIFLGAMSVSGRVIHNIGEVWLKNMVRYGRINNYSNCNVFTIIFMKKVQGEMKNLIIYLCN